MFSTEWCEYLSYASRVFLNKLRGSTASGSFRVEQRPWIGLPKTDPDMVLSRAGLRPQQVDLYLSWNGATAVDTWRIRGVDNPSSPDNRPIEIQRCKRSGFETHCTVWAEKMVGLPTTVSEQQSLTAC